MASNHAIIVYLGPNSVEVQSIDYPKLENPRRQEDRTRGDSESGDDQHLRFRSAYGSRPHDRRQKASCSVTKSRARSLRKGTDVEYLEIGDLVTVPFNVACGQCRTCREQQTGNGRTQCQSQPGRQARPYALMCRYGRLDWWPS